MTSQPAFKYIYTRVSHVLYFNVNNFSSLQTFLIKKNSLFEIRKQKFIHWSFINVPLWTDKENEIDKWTKSQVYSMTSQYDSNQLKCYSFLNIRRSFKTVFSCRKFAGIILQGSICACFTVLYSLGQKSEGVVKIATVNRSVLWS